MRVIISTVIVLFSLFANAQDEVGLSREIIYIKTARAINPPESSYKTKDGNEVYIRKNSNHVKFIRNQDLSFFTKENVLNSKKEHLQKFNYKFPFELYVFGGNFFVGGGYSSFYWNLMAEWKLDRRAKWIYNNQNTIDQNFYKKVLEDPETLKEINKYKNEKLQIDPDYCDPEIQYKPSLMYENSYIHAAYNPEPLRYRITSHKHKDNYFVYMSIISISLLIILMSYIFHYFFKKT